MSGSGSGDKIEEAIATSEHPLADVAARWWRRQVPSSLGQPYRLEDGTWWFGYRHPRDIPDELFLDAIRAARGFWTRDWAMLSDIQAVLAGVPLSKHGYPDEFPGVPRKVVLAKVKRLIYRKVIDGCPCGCRGDFEIIGEGPT